MFIKLKIKNSCLFKKNSCLFNVSLFYPIDKTYPIPKFQHKNLTLVKKREVIINYKK